MEDREDERREGADESGEEKDEDRLEQSVEEREREGTQPKRLELGKIKKPKSKSPR